MKEIFLHDLDSNNYFYDLIIDLAHSQFGKNELLARGIIASQMKDLPGPNEFKSRILKFNFPEEVNNQILNFRAFTPNVFVPGFSRKEKDLVYKLEPNFAAGQMIRRSEYSNGINIRLTHMTVITAFQFIISKLTKQSSAREFFRHIRNAAAHNGKFHFTKDVIDSSGELKKTAKWKNFNISPDIQGLQMFAKTKSDSEYFWGQGDFIEFLIDFQKIHPEILINTDNQ